MQYIKKFFILTVLIFSITQTASAELPFYLDFKYILNESDAGKKAQVFLKKKITSRRRKKTDI
jgi:Skp family chaperone for outer membrane proteins